MLKGISISHSVEETIRVGKTLARSLKKGAVVALIGDLGAGKTVFTKGIAAGLGVKNAKYVNSPTFVIIKEYKGKMALYHFDFYRLNAASFLDATSFDEYFYGGGVCVIEWADKIRPLLPKRHIEVRLSVLGEGQRKITVRKVA